MAATDSASDAAAELRAYFSAHLRAQLRAKLARIAVGRPSGTAVSVLAQPATPAAHNESIDAARTSAGLERAAANAITAHPRLDSLSTATVTITAAIEPMPAV